MGTCGPTFLKKVPFLGAKVAHLQNEKSISRMNALFYWKESALFAVVKKKKFSFGL
jgi:hypothetical protein